MTILQRIGSRDLQVDRAQLLEGIDHCSTQFVDQGRAGGVGRKTLELGKVRRFHRLAWYLSRYTNRPLGIALLTVGTAFMLGLLYHLRTRRLQQRAATLDRLVAQRTAELELANQQLKLLSNTDSLTGLLNRRALYAAAALLQAQRQAAAYQTQQQQPQGQQQQQQHLKPQATCSCRGLVWVWTGWAWRASSTSQHQSGQQSGRECMI